MYYDDTDILGWYYHCEYKMFLYLNKFKYINSVRFLESKATLQIIQLLGEIQNLYQLWYEKVPLHSKVGSLLLHLDV